jgi:hypothetical protein
VAAIDLVAYDKTFKHGKAVVTIEESVQFHLNELAKLGQLERIAEAGGAEVAPVEIPAVTSMALSQPRYGPDGNSANRANYRLLEADRDKLESARSSKALANFASYPKQAGWQRSARTMVNTHLQGSLAIKFQKNKALPP